MNDDHVYVPVDVELYKELLDRYPRGANSVIENVLIDFLERTSEDFAHNENRGIYWDRLFLPNGTEIRTKYFGQYYEGKIEDERIKWDGEEYQSVSRLISAMRGGTSNNAWTVTELKRPNDRKWSLADRFR